MQVFSFVSRAYESQNAQVISRQFLSTNRGTKSIYTQTSVFRRKGVWI